MIDFELGAKWCSERELSYSLDIKRDTSDLPYVFYVTIYYRNMSGEIEDFVTGEGKNKDEAMAAAQAKWGEAKPVTSYDLLRLCLDFMNQCQAGDPIISPTSKHPAPFDSRFLGSELKLGIENHLKE
jgi:hypothetical protein